MVYIMVSLEIVVFSKSVYSIVMVPDQAKKINVLFPETSHYFF